MLKTIQYCDVCQMEVTHVTKFSMVTPFERKEWKIDCLCEACRDAIENALDMRQHAMEITVTPYKSGMCGVYTLDENGRKIPKSEKNKEDLEYLQER